MMKSENIVQFGDNYICVLKITGINIFNYQDKDKSKAYSSFEKAEASLKLKHKYIFGSTAADVSEQKRFIGYKLQNAFSEYSQKLLNRQLNIIDNISQTQSERTTYLVIFAEASEKIEKREIFEKLISNADTYIRNMTETNVTLCTAENTFQLFQSLLYGRGGKSENHTDVLLPNVLSFRQTYIQADDKYMTSIVVSEYPSFIPDLYYANVVNRFSDVIASIDVDYDPQSEMMKQVDDNMGELDSRQDLKLSKGEKINAAVESNNMANIYLDIRKGNERVAITTLRFYVFANDKKSLIKQVENIISELDSEGIKAFVPINAMKYEYFALVKPENTIGNAIPLINTFSRQYPFYYQSHLDPHGMYFGDTTTGGPIFFDMFRKTETRKSFDAIATGVNGSGKSVLLKQTIQDAIVCGNRVLALDVEGEYERLAKVHGGVIVKFGLNDVQINPLEIRQSFDENIENEETGGHAESNFIAELSRIITFFYQYVPSMTDSEANALRSCLMNTYKLKGISDTALKKKINPSDFPTFTDLVAEITRQKKSASSSETKSLLEKIEGYVKPLSAGGMYGSMFNGISKINISNEKLIIFDVKAISEMDEHIYNAQLFLIVSLMWSEICDNVRYNNHIQNPYDRRYVTAIIDEAHRFLNADNMQILRFTEKLTRRSRKYDASLFFATQNVLDLCGNSDNRSGDKLLKTIFSLIQYKIVLQQPSEIVGKLHEYFPQFSESELKSTANFSAGEMLLGIEHNNILHCKRYAPDEDLLYMGNSRDVEEINVKKAKQEVYTK